MKNIPLAVRKLNARGFAHHIILPVVAILAVVGIGTYTLHAIHAANAQYYSGPCTGTTYTKVGTSGACVNQAKDIMDGLQHANWHSYRTATKLVSGSTFKYGPEYYLDLNKNYDASTQAALKNLTNSSVGLTSGTSATAGWQIFCTTVAKSGINLSTNQYGKAALNFKNGNKTNQTISQIFSATCGKLVGVKSSGSGSGSSGSTGNTGSTGSTSSGSGSTSGSTKGGSGCTPSSSSATPYASALSAYKVLSQSYTASQMNSCNWAKNANDTQEGGGSCPVGNTTYDSANSAVKLSTKGTAANPGSNSDCGHIRSAGLISTNGTVVESRIWLPGSGSKLIDWASYWTDGTNWPTTGELDAIETQYGQSYVTYHYGSNNSSVGTASWESRKLSSTAANDAVAGWNTVDMEFQANYAAANVYINGKLYTTVPGSVLARNSQYINWGISGPNLGDPNHASWPSGAGYEEVQYLKVFTK